MIVFAGFLLVSPVFIFVIPFAWLQRRNQPQDRALARLILCQLPAGLVFLAVSRPIYPRYFIYLIPSLALLLTMQLRHTGRLISEGQPERPHLAQLYTALVLVAVPGIIMISSLPRPLELLVQEDDDSHRLAAVIAERTEPDAVVMSDYATLNFLAARASVFEASIIAGWQITSGAVTAEHLIDRLREEQVAMVLVHVKGGVPAPHHLVNLHGYELFRQYLESNYVLTETFDRNGQLIEIWEHGQSG
jgi:hypothetical protein